MIARLRKVDVGIYRGAAPSIEDMVFLHKVLGIKKIISLDLDAGKRIERVCKLLGIKHLMMPIEIDDRSSLIKVLKYNICNLLNKGKPTFLHCREGKDRTGLLCALYRIKCQNTSYNTAIKEALSLGFGIGVPPEITNLYKKILQKAAKVDENAAYDIVSNQREYPSDYRDYSLDEFEQQSWSPYADYRVQEFPYATQYIDYPEQYQSRIDYGLDDSGIDQYLDKSIPQVGQWDSGSESIQGFGPSLVGSGFI